MSTWDRSTRTALRMRVNMSAMGSVIMMFGIPLPTRLFDARNQTLVCQIAETDPADAEFPIYGPRTTAYPAPPMGPGSELRRAERLGELGFTCHAVGSSGRWRGPRGCQLGRAERHTELPQQLPRFVVAVG